MLCDGVSVLLHQRVVFLFLSMKIVLAWVGSAWKAMNPFQLWKVARPQFMGHLIVFLIVGMALLNVIALLSAFTLFLLLPPMLVYAGLVAAQYARQLGRNWVKFFHR